MEKPFNNPSQPAYGTDIIQMSQGKLPPQALDFEESVLCALMIDKKGIDEVIDILRPDAFYKKAHQEIYKAIYTLFQNSENIDILTVCNQLRKDLKLKSVGGETYIVTLSQKVASSSHIEVHARIIIQKYIQRSIITISNEIIEDSYKENTDVFELLDSAEAKFFEITQGNLKKSYESAEGLVAKAIKGIEEASQKEGDSGVSTGFTKLDKLTSGWQPSDLIIIAARPGMGKPAFVISMLKNMAIDFKYPVALFSLEMSSVQLITRMMTSETQLSGEKLRKGSLDSHEWEILYNKVQKLSEAPIFLDDTPSLSVFDLRAKARRLVSQHGVKIIVIDYLQLMTAGGSGGNREQEISTISRNLKGLAKELSIPIVALSQLSRAVETRGGSKRPLLSDLRESGAIEQDADIVSFIFRPEYYGLTEWDDDEQSPCAGQAEFIMAKHRNGSLDNIRLKFEGQFAKFSDLSNDFETENGLRSKMNTGFNDEVMSLPDASDVFGDDDGNKLPF